MGQRQVTGRASGRGTERAVLRARRRRLFASAEVLEGRALLAVTSTTPVPVSVIEGSAFNGGVMDFTANDAGPFTATIVWGDLTPQTAGVIVPVAGGFEVQGTHTYADDGTNTISVQIVDTADATSASNTTTATVGEALLSLTAIPFTAPEGPGATSVPLATLGDPGSTAPPTDYTASIDWGNGVTTAGVVSGGPGTYTISGTPPYADEGPATATVTAFDNDDPGFTITIGVAGTITDADTFTNGTVAPLVGLVEGKALPSGLAVATFSDPGYPTNDPADFNATINFGDGSPPVAGTIVGTGTVGNFGVITTADHIYKEEGTFTLSVTVNDDAPGTATVSMSAPLVVADAPLTPGPALPPVLGTEGAPLTNVDVATFLDADPLGTVTDYVATINWGDGTPVTAGVVLQDAAGLFHVVGSHTYTEESSIPFTITTLIIDNGDGRTVTDPTDQQVTVTTPANIAQSPLLPVANAVVGVEGTAIPAATALATFTDTGGAQPIGNYSATVNWGDGSGPHPATVALIGGSGGNFQVISSGAFTYKEEGIFALTITITDSDAANPNPVPTTAATTSTATIADAPLTASATQPVVPASGVLNEGVEFIGSVASFTDANPTAPISDFSAIIDWGDSSATSLGTITQPGGAGTAFVINGTHTYKDQGSYKITVLIKDVGGSQVTTTSTATIGDPPLTSPTAIAQTYVEGKASGPIVLATFIDADPNATAHDWNAVITWGDGSPNTIATVVLAGGDPATGGNIFQVIASHTYPDENPAGAASVTITDTDDLANTPVVLPLNVSVVDAPLTSAGSTVEAVEGIPFDGQLIATFTDANPFATAADFTTAPGSITVNWGDGTSSTGAALTITSSGTPNGVTFSIFGSHTYTEEGSFKVTTTIVDAGGSVTIAHGLAIVADAPLSIADGQPNVSTTESPIFPVPVFGAPLFAGPVAAFDDANPAAPVSDFKATIDWGDGTPQSAGTISQPGGPGTAFVITGSHTYGDAGVNGGVGTYPITVNIHDAGGSVLTVTNTANVADIPITLTGTLSQASDTGASPFDAITKDNTPTFSGNSEPRSTVTLLAAPTTANGTIIGGYVVLGQTTTNSSGVWHITSRRLPDGYWTIAATAIDQFGKTTTGNTFPATPVTILPSAVQGPLLIDTAGPKVDNVIFNRLNGEVDVVFQDGLSGMNLATVVDANNYSLVKQHSLPAKFLVTNLVIVPLGIGPTAPVEVRVIFNSGAVLKGGFYTFTIHSTSAGRFAVQDIAGNDLDGEFYGKFPSGNNQPGGDFIAQLDAIHDKVFAAQTVVGTASFGNLGNGGPPVGAVHSGVFTPVTPRGVINVLGIPAAAATKITAKSKVVAGPKKKN